MDLTSIVGFGAATLTTSAFIPQAIKTIRTKQTKDISLWMFIILTMGTLLWLIYGICKTDWPIILANSITILLIIPILAIKMMNK